MLHRPESRGGRSRIDVDPPGHQPTRRIPILAAGPRRRRGAQFKFEISVRLPNKASRLPSLCKRKDFDPPLTRGSLSANTETASESAEEGAGPMATEAASSAGAGAAYEEERRKRILQNLKHLEVRSDRKSTRLNSSHSGESRMPSSA